MTRLLLALSFFAALLWLLLRATGGTDSVESRPVSRGGAATAESAEGGPAPIGPGGAATAPGAHKPMRNAVRDAAGPGSTELAVEDAVRTLRFVVEAPEGEIADRSVRLVMEKKVQPHLDGYPNVAYFSSEAFVFQTEHLGDWLLVDRAAGALGGVLELALPEGVRTRVRMEAPCALLPPFESTRMDTGGAPHALRPGIAGELSFRLVPRAGEAVPPGEFEGRQLSFYVSPLSGLEDALGEGTPLSLRFDESHRSSIWGVAPGARVIPGANVIEGAGGVRYRALWPGSVLGPLPHGEVEVEVAPLIQTEVHLLDDDSGEPICGEFISPTMQAGGRIDVLRTNQDGRTAFDSVSTFHGTVTVRVDGYASQEIRFDAARAKGPLVVRLRRAPRLRGTLRDLARAPAAGVRLRRGLGASISEAGTTNAFGEFSFSRPTGRRDGIMLSPPPKGSKERGVPPGAYDGFVLVPAWRSGGDHNLELTLARPVSVYGKAMDESGQPLANGTVRASFIPPTDDPDQRMVTYAGDTAWTRVRGGVYRLANLAPGTWRMTLHHGGIASAQPPLSILEDTKLDLRWEAAAGTMLTGRAVDEKGHTHRFLVRLQGPHGNRSMMTQEDGAFRFAGLTPGRYVAWARSLDGDGAHLAARLVGVASWDVSASGTLQVPNLVAAQGVHVVCIARSTDGEALNGFRVQSVDPGSRLELLRSPISRGQSARFDVPADSRVILRLLDLDGNVVRESRHTFQAGSHPIVDLSPR